MPGHLLSDTEDDDHEEAIRRATRRLQKRQQLQREQEEASGFKSNHDSHPDNKKSRASSSGQKAHRGPSHTRTQSEQSPKAHLTSSDASFDGYFAKMKSWLQMLRVQLGQLRGPFEHAVQPIKNILYLLIIAFFDALSLVIKTCSMIHQLLDALVPRIVVHIILVTAFSLMIVLGCISLLAAYAVDRYCSVVSTFTWVPLQFTEICMMTTATQHKVRGEVSKEDTLEGWHPLVPSLYGFLWEALDSVEDDLDTALTRFNAYNQDLSTSYFKDGFTDGISLCRQLEFEFMKQQRSLWTNINLYMREYPTDRPRQHWIWDCLGFPNKQLIKEAQELNKQLAYLL